jgi:hypothetical protein
MDEWIQERIETPDDIVIDNRNNNPKNTSLPKYQVFDDPEYGMIHSLSLDKLEKAVEL